MKKINAIFIASSMLCIGGFVSGCVSGPTYGTDKTASQQLASDFSNLVSFRSANNNSTINTKPRPELVTPGPNADKTLPPPQVDVVKSGTPDWPESPEHKRQRLRNEATANQGNPTYVSPIVSGGASAAALSSTGLNGIHRSQEQTNPRIEKAQREDYLRRKKELAGGSATQRKYLSEPPLSYRQPAATAPVGEKGEDESKKERARKKAFNEASGKKSWWPF